MTPAQRAPKRKPASLKGIRTTRTLRVTEVRVDPERERLLAELYKMNYWEALLDEMEASCIQIETCLIDAPIGDPEEILGAHAVTKAAWLFFQHVQKKVYSAYQKHAGQDIPAPKPSLNDLIQSMEGVPIEPGDSQDDLGEQ
jgi:hypothetical protein